MFIVFIPIKHLHVPQRAAIGHRFDRAKMQRFVRHLRRCRIGDEVKFTARDWVKQGCNDTISLGMLVDIGGDTEALGQFQEQCSEFKITLIAAGEKDNPSDLIEVAATHGMAPTGTIIEGEQFDIFGRPWSTVGMANHGR